MDPHAVDSIPPSVLAALAREDQGPKTTGLIATFTALAFIAVCLRFFTRVHFAIHVGWEDYFIVVSIVFSILSGACQIMQVHWGFGKHQVFVDLPSTIHALKYLYFGILCYGIGFTFTKVSILTQYKRIFSVQATSIPIYVVMGLSISGGIAAHFAFMFSCVPIDAFWNLNKKPEAQCINIETAEYALGSLNAATDLMIAALPIRAIWRLQLFRGQKIALVLILSLGWFVCIVSILRVLSLHDLSRNPTDQSFFSAPPIYWASIEMNLAIVCACAPSLKPLIGRIVPSFSSRNIIYESGAQSRTRGSKLSIVGRSFQKLSGRDGSGAGSSGIRNERLGLEQGVEMNNVTALPSAQPKLKQGTEVNVVSALPTAKRTYEEGHIMITQEVDQRYDRRTSDASSRRFLQGQLGPI